MDAPHTRARRLRDDAERLLAVTGMVELLSRYGPVTPTGSFAYDLMTWRDIDLCLAVDRPETEPVFAKK